MTPTAHFEWRAVCFYDAVLIFFNGSVNLQLTLAMFALLVYFFLSSQLQPVRRVCHRFSWLHRRRLLRGWLPRVPADTRHAAPHDRGLMHHRIAPYPPRQALHGGPR